MQYFLGLDNGGTSTKAAVYDENGIELAVAATDTKMLVPRPGFTERDMEEMWRANLSVLRMALEKAAIDPHDVACVACCGHGKGLYLWGEDGRPVRNGIISTDNRAYRYPLDWEEKGLSREIFARSCQHVLASQPVSLLAWLRDNEPEAIRRTKWIFECKDYVRFRLTGEARAEITDYSGTNLVNLHTGAYDPALLALFGLSDCLDKLPPLCASADICGGITREVAESTGLIEGTPVAGGAFDIDACALAVNVVDERHICMIAGTWSINEYLASAPVTDGSVMMNSFFCLPGRYLIEECSPTSAGNNEWFIRTLLPELMEQTQKTGGSIYAVANDMVASVPATEFCPIFLPFLMASNVHPNAAGTFAGVSNYHTRAHLLRGVYEGIAFSHRWHLEKLLASKTTPTESIRLAGGAAASEVWTQIFADVMGMPVETVAVNETGALGCAILARKAVTPDLDVAGIAQKMCRVSAPVLPVAENVAAYEKKYHLYKRVVASLDGVWDEMQTLKNEGKQA